MEHASEQLTELAKAMLRVQAELQPVVKDAANSFTKSNYATLNAVMDACRHILLANGIWLLQYPVPSEPGTLGLVTKLTHAESGQWQSSLAVAPLPKTDPQGYGSCMTYLRRYALTAMLGMVTEDDDGEAASLGRKQGSASRQNSAKAPPTRRPSASSKQAVPAPQASLQSLPTIDGISYHTVPAQDGRLCIVAKGDTLAKKSLLAAAGFRWDSQQKLWWKYADVF